MKISSMSAFGAALFAAAPALAQDATQTQQPQIVSTQGSSVDTATPPPPAKPLIDVVSLRLMRDKKIITEDEYQSARAEIGSSTGDVRADDAPSVVVGKWSATLYGFLENDFILDSTQSFNDVAGNTLVQRSPGSPQPLTGNVSQYGGGNARVQFSARNTRLGLRIRAPEVNHVRVSGTLEMDFLGTDPSPVGGTSNTDAAFFNNPTMRIRHAYFKIETPIVDILVGQYWQMFGWQPAYFPNSVQIQGLPGELYERTPQVRLSHKFKFGDAASLEIAAAALRPPTRDGAIPDLAGGLRFSIDALRGVQTAGATSTTLQPASIAVTGDYRTFNVPEFSALPTNTVSLSTGGIAVDAFIPIIPATEKRHSNALSVSGEFAYGGGISDMYTSLTGGVTFPSLINTTGQNPAPTYPQNVDNGMVVMDNNNHDLHAIVWMTSIVGLQYYLPVANGRVWISGNVAHTESPNIADFTQTTAPNPNASNYAQQAAVRKSEDFVDGNLFFEPLPSVRIGLEYAVFMDHYVDKDANGINIAATNHRGMISGFFIF